MATDEEWTAKFIGAASTLAVMNCMYPRYVATLKNWWYLYFHFLKWYREEPC